MRISLTFLLSFFVITTGFAQTTIERNLDEGIITVHFKNDTTDTTFTIPAFSATLEGTFKDSVLVNYSGVWSKGFEKNRYTPCGKWVPDSLGGTAFLPNRMGFSKGEEVWNFAIKSKTDSVSFFSNRPENSTSLFIEGKGWLVGPSHYDHFGTNRYTIKTIEFKKIRWTVPKECEQ